jgi:uncharacterized protein YcgI (DUF1989 family)
MFEATALKTAIPSIHVPGGHGRAFGVKAGDRIKLIDVKGQQALDFVAMRAVTDLVVVVSAPAADPKLWSRPTPGPIAVRVRNEVASPSDWALRWITPPFRLTTPRLDNPRR